MHWDDVEQIVVWNMHRGFNVDTNHFFILFVRSFVCPVAQEKQI